MRGEVDAYLTNAGICNKRDRKLRRRVKIRIEEIIYKYHKVIVRWALRIKKNIENRMNCRIEEEGRSAPTPSKSRLKTFRVVRRRRVKKEREVTGPQLPRYSLKLN